MGSIALLRMIFNRKDSNLIIEPDHKYPGLPMRRKSSGSSGSHARVLGVVEGADQK